MDDYDIFDDDENYHIESDKKQKIYENCIHKNLGITFDEAVLNGTVSDCFDHCFMIADGYIVNDKINPKRILQKLPDDPDLFKEIEAECHTIRTTKKCELGSRLVKCYVKIDNDGEEMQCPRPQVITNNFELNENLEDIY
ncbi:Odorant-binding protein 56f-1 [Drosophila ananassae]|uniref:Odorant-binding protein 56f-1 n=2 Tax=Drosophila ananassae TaxID=7217 RepID=B3M9W4_DROAN|nr:Odorant-binding protein 56f-1 [Drosophila ananassae]